MAGIFFTAGEQKKRAGVYNRYENHSGVGFAGASDGVVALMLNCNWGELGKVVNIYTMEQANELFGTTGNTYLIEEAFLGGANLVRVVRIGTGGTQASAELNDTDATKAINVTAKYVGTRDLSYVVRSVLGDETQMEFVLLDGGKIIEKFRFTTKNSVDALVKAGAESAYLNFKLVDGYDAAGKTIAAVSEVKMVAGTNPTTSTADYSAAMTALEPFRWNTLCCDSNDPAVHALMAAYRTRTYQDGKTGYAVVGEPISIEYETRLTHASAFNDYKVIYVGGGWYDSEDKLIDGFRAAARIAGMVAHTPSNMSLTHTVISGADRSAEMLTNMQYEQSIDNGMITFAESPSGSVWIESGITTLVYPSGEDDDGWKKIKRSKIRFELMDRVNDTVAPLVGNINNDADGRATVIQAVQGLLNAMIAEKKLFAGATIAEDAANAPVGDSAWYIITADDIDSLEKLYFTYRFRFASNS